jgi:hypothetical protein
MVYTVNGERVPVEPYIRNPRSLPRWTRIGAKGIPKILFCLQCQAPDHPIARIRSVGHEQVLRECLWCNAIRGARQEDKTIIHKIHGDGGAGHEVIPFINPVNAVGNIEDWLTTLVQTMQLTSKDHARQCSSGVLTIQNDLSKLRSLVDM